MRYALLIAAICATCLCTTADAQERQQKVALVVGVNKYQKRAFSDLHWAEHDAEALAAELTRLGFDKVILLKGSSSGGQQATHANILAQLEELLRPVTKSDVVLLSFSGHGQQFTPRGKTADEPFYCPVDATAADDAASLVSINHVLARLNADGGVNLLLIDACRNDPSRSRDVGVQGRITALPDDTQIFYSCRAGQKSFENDELEHGLFAYCVLEGLRGDVGRGAQVSWSGLLAHVDDRMSSQEILDKLPPGKRQQPIYAGNEQSRNTIHG